MEVEDIKDFADAIEKVVYNISDLRDSNLSKQTDKEVYDAIKAIDENVKIKGQKGLFIFSDPAGAKACLALAKSFKQKTLLIISDRKYLFFTANSILWLTIPMIEVFLEWYDFEEFDPDFVFTEQLLYLQRLSLDF